MSHSLRRLRIPYTTPFPAPPILPRSANTPSGAATALANFLLPEPSSPPAKKAVVLTGAGLSVASGLADYRGTAGTYTLNPTYRPIYHHEFLAAHAARRRYWARSFLGWPALQHARKNTSHTALEHLAHLGLVGATVTQNVDSFQAGPQTTELHGYLRAAVCLTCGGEHPRDAFQRELELLNPRWRALLEDVRRAGALDTEDPAQRAAKGLRTNPDGDVELPEAPFHTFRYPACPGCVEAARGDVETDADGAWTGGAGVLKPAVVMFGESIKPAVKEAAERAVDGAERLLVCGSSLATYSAWRLVKRAYDAKMSIAVLNRGGVRGEEVFFKELIGRGGNDGRDGVRANEGIEAVLPGVVQELRARMGTAELE